MKLRPTAQDVPVARVGRSGTDRRVTAHTNKLASSFRLWQRSYLRNGPSLPGPERWAAGLFLTGAVCERQDLEAIGASAELYATPVGPTLEWLRADKRRGARALSTFLALSTDPRADVRCGGRFVEVLVAGLRKLDTWLAGAEDVIGIALACSAAWHFLELPQHLFSHVAGDLAMTPLPRSAWARLESTHAPADHFQTALCDEDDTARALEGYFQSGATNESAAVIQDILDSIRLRDIDHKTDAQLLEDLASIWRGKIDAAEAAGSLTSLQLACALHLAALGEHKPNTIIGYVKAGFPVVHAALAGIELAQASTEQLSTRLAAALETASGQTRVNAKAYVTHLWRYAQQWIDVEPLSPSLLPEVAVSTVDANTVWQHESARIDGWLDGPQADPALARQTRLVRRLMVALKARVSEVMFLQVRNVHVYENTDYVDVEIALRGRLHGLKAKDSQRTGRVHGQLAAELLEHVNRRLTEHNALGRQLLFGTKAEPYRVYRLAAMYAWLNRAVKAATGDPSSCCHHFRHAAVDGEYAAMTLADIENGKLEQLRVDAGHADLRSTQRSYLHQFARLLRDAVEESLREWHKVSDTVAAAWSAIPAHTLRQSLTRQRERARSDGTAEARSELQTTADWYWFTLRESAVQCSWPSASEPFLLWCPLPPKGLGAARPWTIADVIALLGDLQHRDTPNQACMQRRLPPIVGATATTILLELGQEQLGTRRVLIDEQLTSPAAAMAALGLRPVSAYHPKYAKLLDTFREAHPSPMPDEVWDAWRTSSSGDYIKLNPRHRPDRWIACLFASGLPASKLLVRVDTTDAQRTLAVQRLVRAAAVAARTSASVRFAHCPYNDRRGRAYVLVSDESEELTHYSGAAFSTAGLRVIFLAMRIASSAIGSMKEAST